MTADLRQEAQALIGEFIEFQAFSRNKSPRTLQSYSKALERLTEYLAAKGIGLKEPADADLLHFTGKHLSELGIGPRGRRPYIAAVRVFWQWLNFAGKVKRNPAASIPYPRLSKKLGVAATLDTLERLMYAPDLSTFEGVRDSAMLAIMGGCGVRVSGLVGLNEGDLYVDKVDGEPRIFATVREKGEKDRRIILPAEADLYLRMYLEHEQLKQIDRAITNDSGRDDKVLFISTSRRDLLTDQYIGEARRMSRRNVNARLRHYGKKAGLPPEQMHAHALRHLFGTELVESDTQDRVAQQLMGHDDIRSTSVYTHMAVRKLAKAIDKANPLAKIKTPVSEFLRAAKPKA